MFQKKIYNYLIVKCCCVVINVDINYFSDYKITKKMIEGSYKKLKSYLFYDKTLLFAKRKLAKFESNSRNFEDKLKELAVNLSSNNYEYFDSLINEIDFKIMPKKFVSDNQNDEIIRGTTDHNKFISRVNFFIDLPIELQIIDFLWTLLIGKITDNYPQYYEYSAATRFKKSLYTIDEDFYKGIDFNSNRCFQPYYGLYSKWRDNAFVTIKNHHDSTDTMLICLDLKSFYYSVEFDFEKLNVYFDDDRLDSISFLTKIIEKIYFTYTSLISNYKKGIKNSKDKCVFPIGVTSVLVLRELYLYDMDKMIADNLNPLYYSRYVDDINIVLKVDTVEELTKKDLIEKYLLETKIVRRVNDNELKFNKYSNVRIQQEKVNCFYFKRDEEITLLDVYEETIRENSSEANLLPDTDILKKSFTKSAYNIQNLELSNKIRDLGFVKNNNYNATKFINSLHRILKNTKVDKNFIDEYLTQIEEFYHGSNGLEYSNSWRAIFELYLICDEKSRGNRFRNEIIGEINKLNFKYIESSEILKGAKSKLLKKLKYDLKEKLQISIALAAALNPSFSKSAKISSLIQDFRNCNFMNHNLVSYPLLNYSSIGNNSLIEMDLSKLFSKSNRIFELDKFKLNWSPRFIRANEFYVEKFIHDLFNDKDTIKSLETIQARFFEYNNLKYEGSNLNFKKSKSNNDIETFFIKYKNRTKYYSKIALVNTKINEEDAFSFLTKPENILTHTFKSRVFSALNIAKKEEVDYIVFPEFYFPIQWLSDISRFAIENNISIITGLQYITINNRVYNNICMVTPYFVSGKFNSGLLLFREKNFYAPKERIYLAQMGYSCKNSNDSIYYIMDNGRFRFTTILCYEFTDIEARANMKSKIEVLFVPQLNKDTNYFSSIVEASARDLHCFVVQANTSIYGDSRITAPYKTQKKNLVQVKGGETDVVMIGNLDVKGLQDRRNEYNQQLNNTINNCINCNKRKKHKVPTYCIKCSQYEFKENTIKGTPPNFKNKGL